MRAQLPLHFFYLDLHATRTDDIVAPSNDAETRSLTCRSRNRGDDTQIVGHKAFGTDCRGIDNQTAVGTERHINTLKRGVPVAAFRSVEPSQGDMRKGLCHPVGAPHGIGEVFQFLGE